MIRWTTFDQETTSSVRTNFPQGTVIELHGGQATQHAAQQASQSGHPVVAILPVAMENAAGIAIFRAPNPAIAPTLGPLPTRPGGFLGLSDELVFEQEQEQEEGHGKRSWWRRLLGKSG
ncbi:MAG TPA: hypothetical protein VFK06_10225 [Candidatus Angelobacter sp.]|nr:hypothetical protein [Candidatus Angelobacter sp.]